MIASIIVGSGNARKVIPMSRAREDRQTVARVVTHHLLPTPSAIRAAEAAATPRRASYHRERRIAARSAVS